MRAKNRYSAFKLCMHAQTTELVHPPPTIRRGLSVSRRFGPREEAARISKNAVVRSCASVVYSLSRNHRSDIRVRKSDGIRDRVCTSVRTNSHEGVISARAHPHICILRAYIDAGRKVGLNGTRGPRFVGNPILSTPRKEGAWQFWIDPGPPMPFAHAGRVEGEGKAVPCK